MDIVGDEILRILHDGGVDSDGIVVNTFAILLKSGRCFELTEEGVTPIDPLKFEPHPVFDRYIGQRIIAVDQRDDSPACGLRLGNGCVLIIGCPHLYYVGLQEADA